MESKIKDFLDLPVEEKIRLVSEGVKPETPFYLERIITAIETGNTLGLNFLPKWVFDSYIEIKEFQNKQS